MNHTTVLRRILIISNSSFISGAETSLYQFLKYHNRDNFHVFFVTSDKNCSLYTNLSGVSLIHIPLKWFCYTLNPIRLIDFLTSLIIVSLKLSKIVNANKIEIIYSNTVKSNIYGITVKLITGKKLIWHARDNVKKNFLAALLTRYSDRIVCVSRHIYDQVNAPSLKKAIIHGGIDTKEWKLPLKNNLILRDDLNLESDTKLVAQIGQLTCWKNCLDYIEAARYILQKTDRVHFLLIGDDISGRENEYKDQLHKRVEDLGLVKCFTFLGYRKDVKDIMSQIDLLIHTAINEPFGRVIIEAMALGKPVISYNCGGPGEIIVDGETGFLVPLFDKENIAKRTIILLKDNSLAVKFGKAGRKRVMNKFNIREKIFQMEEIFNGTL